MKPQKLEFSWRVAWFCLGALGAVAEAIDIARRADIQVKPAHLIALGCTALAAYTMKYHRDLTQKDASELEERVRRESAAPQSREEP